jgi:hypothetical protein
MTADPSSLASLSSFDLIFQQMAHRNELWVCDPDVVFGASSVKNKAVWVEHVGVPSRVWAIRSSERTSSCKSKRNLAPRNLKFVACEGQPVWFLVPWYWVYPRFGILPLRVVSDANAIDPNTEL